MSKALPLDGCITNAPFYRHDLLLNIIDRRLGLRPVKFALIVLVLFSVFTMVANLLQGTFFANQRTDDHLWGFHFSAHFAADGQQVGGSDKIEVEKHEAKEEGVWWFSVKDVKDRCCH